MKRRKFVELAALAPASGAPISCEGFADPASPAKPGQAGGALRASGTGGVPDWAARMRSSDRNGLGPDGKPDPDYSANGTGHSRADFKHDPSKPHQMTLTQEEQDIMDGKKGEVLAKVMKTVVTTPSALASPWAKRCR